MVTIKYDIMPTIIFTERELMFTFAVCCRPSVRSVCLSYVCNVRAPYSGGSNFWATFLRH